jgi:hypothetical protein
MQDKALGVKLTLVDHKKLFLLHDVDSAAAATQNDALIN